MTIPQQVKKGIKIIGIACSSFDRTKDRIVPIIGVIYRGSDLFEGIEKTIVQVDGEDATEKIANMICESIHYQQLKIIMTRGVTIAGFNYLDLALLSKKTSLPVISVVDREPDMNKIADALLNLLNGEKRLEIIKKNGLPKPIISSPNEEPVYVQSFGLAEKEVIQIIQNATKSGRIPEPIRVARLIAVAFS
ncbi:MAG: DUF99 family protein [Asgard group archaeon]|nr:DUF99 family protein [Asgard group archaeon]